MKTRVSLILLLLPLNFLISGCTKKTTKESGEASSTKVDHEDQQSYYTCPMHPQVHEHKPGKCPICGMTLVEVLGQPSAQAAVTKDSEIFVSNSQLQLAGISQYTVTRHDLTFVLPVSGRWLSSREVAFQVFESDLQNIRVGSDFSGSSGSSRAESLSGKIRSIDNLVDPSSRTVRVLGVLSKPASRVTIDGGFFGEIKSVEKAQLAIPEEAVLRAGTRDLVYLVTKEKKLKAVTIVLGEKAGSEYQVLSGLKEDDVISSGPNFLIDSEAKIRGSHD